jgi:hypothetical protein
MLHLKKLTKDYEVEQNGRNFQNGVENIYFRIFALKGTISAQFLNFFFAFEAYFSYLSNFCVFFSGNPNGGLVQDDVIFERVG